MGHAHSSSLLLLLLLLLLLSNVKLLDSVHLRISRHVCCTVA